MHIHGKRLTATPPQFAGRVILKSSNEDDRSLKKAENTGCFDSLRRSDYDFLVHHTVKPSLLAWLFKVQAPPNHHFRLIAIDAKNKPLGWPLPFSPLSSNLSKGLEILKQFSLSDPGSIDRLFNFLDSTFVRSFSRQIVVRKEDDPDLSLMLETFAHGLKEECDEHKNSIQQASDLRLNAS